MNLFHRIRKAPTHLAHLLGRKKKATVQPKATTKPPRGGLVLPFKRPAPAPAPQQQPAPQRKAAERQDEVQAAVRAERERCAAIFEQAVSAGMPWIAGPLVRARIAEDEARTLIPKLATAQAEDLQDLKRERARGLHHYVPRAKGA